MLDLDWNRDRIAIAQEHLDIVLQYLHCAILQSPEWSNAAFVPCVVVYIVNTLWIMPCEFFQFSDSRKTHFLEGDDQN